MDQKAIEHAAEQLAMAHRSRIPLAELDEGCRPATIVQGHAVQDALVARLGESVAGYKVAGLKPQEVMRGALLSSRIWQSPACIPASLVPLLGIELEIAFRFERAMFAREREYTVEEVKDAVVALPAIEVVATRFADYGSTPVLHRLGDCMSNGALVCGEVRHDWNDFDFISIGTLLQIDGDEVVRGIGGHSAGAPLLPAVALVNEMRRGSGVESGQIVTTGTFTGLVFASPGSTVRGEFANFGAVEIRFEA
jgi:2-keto-4-pentenoate hydratase